MQAKTLSMDMAQIMVGPSIDIIVEIHIGVGDRAVTINFNLTKGGYSMISNLEQHWNTFRLALVSFESDSNKTDVNWLQSPISSTDEGI